MLISCSRACLLISVISKNFCKKKFSFRLKWEKIDQLGPCPNWGYADPPPRLSSKMTMYTWKMHNVLKRMKNQFPDFYLMRYGWFVLKILRKFTKISPKVTMYAWKIRHVLKRMKNWFSFVVYFLSYGRICVQNSNWPQMSIYFSSQKMRNVLKRM